ncbi:glutathione-dependent formaldehyde-activating, GFA [Xylariaceae sp. FL0804]|nr:glutathione-dependent formaldehyde-activating, GFA [Xylariaceae sp. FL0804]
MGSSNGSNDMKRARTDGGDDDWKNRPPYRTTDTNQEFDKKYTAHCHCGRVKYWLSRDRPLASKFCHCIDCQALHGAPFQWAAIFHKEDLHFENGAENLAFYHSSTKQTHYQLPIKVSCAYCHAPIMDEGRNMVLMFPSIIKFGDAEHKKLFDPQCHIFYSQRVVDMPDGKPKWTKLDKDSELMKDVPSHEMQSVVGRRKVETVDGKVTHENPLHEKV